MICPAKKSETWGSTTLKVLLLTCITDLMTPLSVLILAFFRGLTEGPTQVMKANLDRLLISSPVSIRTKPKARSSSTNNRNDHLLGL